MLRGQGLPPENLRLRQYDPEQPPYASRIPKDLWNTAKPTLKRLYDEGMSRAEMLDALANEYGFRPTMHQLNSRMTAWGYKGRKTIGQNAPPQETTEMFRFDAEPVVDKQRAVPVLPNQKDLTKLTMSEMFEKYCSMDNMYLINGICAEKLDFDASVSRQDQLCVTYDVTSVLAPSIWYSKLTQCLSRHLLAEVEAVAPSFTNAAFVFIIANLLQWSCPQTTSIIQAWASDRFRMFKFSQSGKQDDASCLLSCCSQVVFAEYPSMDWYHVTAMKDLPWGYGRSLARTLINAASLSSIDETIVVQPANSIDLRDLRVVDCLLPWCSSEIKRFRLRYFDSMSYRASSLRIRQDCCLQLNFWLLKTWISKVNSIARMVPIKLLRLNDIPEVLTFKLIAQTLCLITVLAVQKTKKFVKVEMKMIEQRPEQFFSKLTKVLHAAVREVIAENGSLVDQVCRKSPEMEELSADADELLPVTCLTPILTEEFLRIRSTFSERRHQAALVSVESLVESLSPVLEEQATGDVMLWKAGSSSSSIASFRRAGIKLKDQYGPPSVSSGSSDFSMRSRFSSGPSHFGTYTAA